MQKLLNQHKHLSPAESNRLNNKERKEKESWEEYSALHDSFTELLSYERRSNGNYDFWQLNYI